MRLTKTDLARVVVQALRGMSNLPPADDSQVVSRARRGTVESLTRHHALACAALTDSAELVTLAGQGVLPAAQGRMVVPMDATEYRAALARVALSQSGAARVLGVDERTSRRWALGEREVPEPVARLLWIFARFPDVLAALRNEHYPPLRIALEDEDAQAPA